MNIEMKPGLIKFNNQAISPYCLLYTVILNNGKNLRKRKQDLENLIKKSKIITFIINKISINLDFLKESSKNTYNTIIGNVIENKTWKLANIDYSLETKSMSKLYSLIGFQSLSICNNNGNITLSIISKDKPSGTLDIELLKQYTYYLNNIIDTIDCYLEVYVSKENFIKDSSGYYTFVQINRDHFKNNYHLLCVFDNNNISNYIESGSRFITAGFTADGYIYIYTHKRFNGTIGIILNKIIE